MKVVLGDACAYCKPPGVDKAQYHRIGSAFIDNDNDRLSLKIDSLPLPSSGWTGWVNIFPRKQEDNTKASKPSKEATASPQDDDIPF